MTGSRRKRHDWGDNKDDYQMSTICDYCDNGQCILNLWEHTQGKNDGVFPDIRQCNDFHYHLPMETDVQKKIYTVFCEHTGYRERL
jgi:hypothetical protein